MLGFGMLSPKDFKHFFPLMDFFLSFLCRVACLVVLMRLCNDLKIQMPMSFLKSHNVTQSFSIITKPTHVVSRLITYLDVNFKLHLSYQILRIQQLAHKGLPGSLCFLYSSSRFYIGFQKHQYPPNMLLLIELLMGCFLNKAHILDALN